MVEYASLVAALAVLASTLTGAFGQKLAVLPGSTAAALPTLSAGAKSQGIRAAEARGAYKRAPYSKPVLKYLFAVGWIGGKKDPVSCLFARVQREEMVQDTLAWMRGQVKLRKQLARRNVSRRMAANVIVEGIAAACTF